MTLACISLYHLDVYFCTAESYQVWNYRAGQQMDCSICMGIPAMFLEWLFCYFFFPASKEKLIGPCSRRVVFLKNVRQTISFGCGNYVDSYSTCMHLYVPLWAIGLQNGLDNLPLLMIVSVNQKYRNWIVGSRIYFIMCV